MHIKTVHSSQCTHEESTEKVLLPGYEYDRQVLALKNLIP